MAFALVIGILGGLNSLPERTPKPPPRYLIGIWMTSLPSGADLLDAPPPLAITRDNRRQWPRRPFGFQLTSEKGFAVDTFSGKVTKDMGPWTPDMTATLILDERELDEIYESMLGIIHFDYGESHPPYGAEHYSRPDFPDMNWGWVELRIYSGTSRMHLKWDSDQRLGPVAFDDWKRLWRLIETIYFAVKARDEYQALPEAKPYVYW